MAYLPRSIAHMTYEEMLEWLSSNDPLTKAALDKIAAGASGCATFSRYTPPRSLMFGRYRPYGWNARGRMYMARFLSLLLGVTK